MLRKALLGLAFGLAASCAQAQTAPSPADVGISKGAPDVFKLKGSDNVWTPFGSIDPSTHIFIPQTNGNIAPNDCVKWGPGLTSAGAACNSVTGGATPANQLSIYTNHAGLVANVTTPTEAWTVQQQGFYAPGDGGDATYQWSFTSYCAGGTSSLPIVADGIVCVLPIGQSASTAGRYLLQTQNGIDARVVGMQPGGQDNSPYVAALMTASGVRKAGDATRGALIRFPPVNGQETYYYFSQPFVMSRQGVVDCESESSGFIGQSTLVFAPGVSGFIQETNALTLDGNFGVSDVRRCSIMGLGVGSVAKIGNFISVGQAGVHPGGGGSGYGTGSGTLTWAGPSCTTNPVLNATASGGAITSVSVATAGVCSDWPGDTVAVGSTQSYVQGVVTSWTVGGGLSAGTGATIDEIYKLVGTNGPWTGISLNQTLANKQNVITLPGGGCGYGSRAECAIQAGDGVIAFSAYLGPGSPLTAPGAYIGAADPSTNTATLAAPYSILSSGMTVNGGANIVDLPAAQKYTIQTTTGSNVAIVTAGPRLLRPGDLIWSDAFLFGTSVQGSVNAIAGTPTVNAGGSGYTGSSGTMTYNGIVCAGASNIAPVLNVTASGGVITGVVSVANPGDCLRATPPPNDTQWVAGGGLSGGSGASFNMTFNQTITLTSYSLIAQANAVATHTSGSPGQMWTIPVGFERRVGGSTHNIAVVNFGVDLDLTCEAGTSPTTGCNASIDQEDAFTFAIIGRLTRGDNTGVSMVIDNVFGHNFFSDEVEGGTLGSTYLNEEYNSQEESTARYALLMLCTSQNYSNFMGAYMSGQGKQDTSGRMNGCLGTDAQGNSNIGIPASDVQTGGLNIGSIYGAPEPQITDGGLVGNWGFGGRSAYILTTAAATASGNIVALPDVPNIIIGGLGIQDITNPFAIPPNTSVTEVGPHSVAISNPVFNGGIRAGDQVQFYNANGVFLCMRINMGLAGDDVNGLVMSKGCGSPLIGFSLTFQGQTNTWDWGNPRGIGLRMAGLDYTGYLGEGETRAIFPGGFLISSPFGVVGSERQVDMGPAADNAAYHLQGDLRLNSLPTPGGNLAWTEASDFTTTLSAPVTSGTTTSVAVAACPSPALPAGAVVSDQTGRTSAISSLHVSQNLGTLASCVGTTLTLQAASLVNGVSGDTIQFLQMRPAAPIANDPAGTSWSLGNNVHLAPVAFASLPSPCAIGTFAVVSDGADSPTYNAAAASEGGSYDPVFCSNGSVWKYH